MLLQLIPFASLDKVKGPLLYLYREKKEPLLSEEQTVETVDEG